MPVLLALLVVVLLFGAGSAIEVLKLVALVALVVWLVGFVVHGSGGRWYRW